MASMKEAIQSLRNFLSDVVGEMRKTDWPSRQELRESTVVVIVSLFLLSLAVAVVDKVLVTVLTKILMS